MAKISDDLRADSDRLLELVRLCAVNRDSRRAKCETYRTWYKQGTNGQGRARFNKLFAHLNRVAAFLFAPGAVRFGVHLPPAFRAAWISAAAVARDEFRQTWSDAEADIAAVLSLEWALVFGGMGMKIQKDPDTGFRLGYIQPWDLGFSREDVSDLEDQDVLCHWYTKSIPQLERWLDDEPRAEAILTKAKEHARPGTSTASRQRLVVSQITGTFPSATLSGGFPMEPATTDEPASQVEEPTVEFVDIWERRRFKKRVGLAKEPDKFEDWLVSTMLYEVDEPLAQRRNPDMPWTKKSATTFLPAELPFTLLTPRPCPDYIFGQSELDELIPIQAWLNDHLEKLVGMVDRQMDPAKFFAGVSEMEEAGRAMSTPGGSYGAAEPNAQMKTLDVKITPEVLQLLDRIDAMFAEVSGVPHALADPGQMGGGVRSQSHFSGAMGVGAGRLRQMALVVEQTLGIVATKAFHLLQRQNTEMYSRDDGPPFLLSQIPSNIRLRVDAHSAAPIFSEQVQQKALALQRAGALSGEDMVELFDMPNGEELKASAKKLSENKAKLTEKQLEIAEEKALKGKPPKPPKA